MVKNILSIIYQSAEGSAILSGGSIPATDSIAIFLIISIAFKKYFSLAGFYIQYLI